MNKRTNDIIERMGEVRRNIKHNERIIEMNENDISNMIAQNLQSSQSIQEGEIELRELAKELELELSQE